MKIRKILASNSKQFRVMAFLKNDKIDDDRGRAGKIKQFLRLLLLKITSGLKNSPGYVF